MGVTWTEQDSENLRAQTHVYANKDLQKLENSLSKIFSKYLNIILKHVSVLSRLI